VRDVRAETLGQCFYLARLLITFLSRNYEKAFYYLSRVLSVNPKNSDAHATIGIIYHLKGKIGDAIAKYHEALKNSNTEVIVTELLEKALQRNADSTLQVVLSEDPDATIDSGGFDVEIEDWDMSKATMSDQPRRVLQTPKLRGGKHSADTAERTRTLRATEEVEYDGEADGTEIFRMEEGDDPFLVDHGDLDPSLSGTFFLHKLRASDSPGTSAGSKRKHSP
jgi:tetratricopeptide (TPR) repeat protein